MQPGSRVFCDFSPQPPIPALREAAAEVGLELRAVLPAGPEEPGVVRRLAAWLSAGRSGEMQYLARSAPLLADVRLWKPWVGSLLLTTLPYPRAGGGFRGGGRVARYALGRDYHHVLGRRLQRLGRLLRAQGLAGRFRAVADAAPLLEREWALRGNLGFRGKNTLLLDPHLGPWQLLGELLVDVRWGPWRHAPAPTASCGSCTRCLEACPTGAFPEPWVLEPRRCVSYWTIEARGWIPRGLRSAFGDRVFGCDDCLEACPFGHRAEDTGAFWGRHPALDRFRLEDLLGLPREAFPQAFRGSPIRRAGWVGLLRNACVALGNLGRGARVLAGVLESHPSARVRGHAAWALARLGERRLLARAWRREEDPAVRAEIEMDLEGEPGGSS